MRNQPHRFFVHSSFLRACFVIFPIYFLVFVSCRTTKQVQYLQGIVDTNAINNIKIPEPIIQKGDLIGITVYSDNPEVTGIYNQQSNTSMVNMSSSSQGSIATGPSGAASQNMPGYMVDVEGNIHFQSIGSIHVEGLNKSQLSNLLREKLGKYLMNPYFNIRFLNYKFTILGEVNKQGVYSMPAEKISILEAIGMAGDLTVYGLKDSILVVREVNGRKVFSNLDVSKADVIASPYYYLQQNDIVIVKTTAKKPTASEQAATKNLAIIATFATIITSISVVLNILLR